ncbi:MAG TPA: hypothetical protein VMC06_15785 [Opitutaceae bacterium]|nr:hypothetical protein [Opitutaceae bacterium]
MRTPLGLVALTVAGFGAGLGAGYWMSHTCTPMPPPASVFSEFRDITRAGPSLASTRPELWREINAELEKLRPEMDAFRKKIQAIDGEFITRFETILQPEQRQKLADLQKRRDPGREASKGREPGKEPAPAAKPAAAPASEAPKSNPPAPRSERAPRVIYESDGLVSQMVFLPMTVERFTQQLGLDATQQAKLRELLLVRRTKFLELVDATPPPSLQLLRIADIIRKAGAEQKK